MTTVAWFHCFAGIAGDMALGACIDAGADVDEVVAILERLPVGGWELETETVMRGAVQHEGLRRRRASAPNKKRLRDEVRVATTS